MANPFENLDKPDPLPSKSTSRLVARKPKPHHGSLLHSLAVLSFLGPFFVAPIVWLMARHALKEMAAGRVDRSGHPQTQSACRLAVVSTCAWSVLLAGFLAYQFLAGGVLIPAAGSNRITQAQFKRVKPDMTRRQVIDILGQPARTDRPGGHLTLYWYEKNGPATFSIEFSEQDRVRTTGFDTPD